MKRFIITVLFGLCALYSQTDKGRFIYGGSFNITNQFRSPYIGDNSFGIALSPEFGYFPVKNFAIMAHLNLGYNSDFEDYHQIQYGLGPEFRYYVGKKNIKFYVFTNVVPTGMYVSYTGGAQPPDANWLVLTTSTGPGLAIFPNPDFVIQTGVSFNTISYFNDAYYYPPDGVTVFSLALNVAFNGLFSIKPKAK